MTREELAGELETRARELETFPELSKPMRLEAYDAGAADAYRRAAVLVRETGAEMEWYRQRGWAPR